MTDQNRQCTYEEVMVDWAIAEVLSPSICVRFRQHPHDRISDRLHDRILAGEVKTVADLGPEETSELIRSLDYARGTLFDLYLIPPPRAFYRATVGVADLLGFSILEWFRQFGASSLNELSNALRRDEITPLRDYRATVLQMLEHRRGGGPFRGFPIAVMTPGNARPVLIEGYKRSIASIWSGATSQEMYFCHR